MSYKGSRHRVINYAVFQNTIEEIRKNSENLTGKPCDKHKEFSKYCLKCWAETDKPIKDEQ